MNTLLLQTVSQADYLQVIASKVNDMRVAAISCGSCQPPIAFNGDNRWEPPLGLPYGIANDAISKCEWGLMPGTHSY